MSHMKHAAFRLVACDRHGRIQADGVRADPTFLNNAAATAALYRSIGYSPPWIGYAAIDEEFVVGGGAFVGAPADGAVEIAYFTLDACQRRSAYQSRYQARRRLVVHRLTDE